MFLTHGFYPDARFTVSIKTRHVTQHQPHLTGGFKALQHLFVQLFAVLKEVVNRALFAMRRNQLFHAHLIRLDIVTSFARQDHQLAHHVFT